MQHRNTRSTVLIWKRNAKKQNARSHQLLCAEFSVYFPGVLSVLPHPPCANVVGLGTEKRKEEKIPAMSVYHYVSCVYSCKCMYIIYMAGCWECI